MSAGWLVDQLPRAMSGDPVLRGFVSAFEQVADTVVDRVDSIEHQVDAGLAVSEMLHFLASWLGVELEPTDPLDYQRMLVGEVGRLLGWRGTRHGMESLLAAATGSPVTVTDGGGIFGRNDPVPLADPEVVVHLQHTGHLDERQVIGFLQGELPLGARLRLEITDGGRDG
ncbi:phage tail protein [Actinoplanes regularis]|uniref:Phage tail protein domain-containing protein n=1 Tax=Actinoplanes regularis TaxID=52697 RepID=A0A239FM30_9ACTN|nr:phage tail protein [Actinoplanes regularis]GIE89675.1 phage tail protein [Actinoplanes regularis]SNS57940.1 phage tail protein domain-containing protein [Actinoplanes regularis]